MLALLTRQAVLIAITVQVTVTETVYEVSINKVIDQAGAVLTEYWWDVDRFTVDEQGRLRRQTRWHRGDRVYETAEAAFWAAMEWMRTQAGPGQ